MRVIPFLICILVSMVGRTQENTSSGPPNVILIVTDDQGYGDLSCHGNPYLGTPNIDKLYSESVRFTDFHVDPTCAPTRAALMTGKYAHHVGVWHTVNGGNHLRTSETTMAELFKSAGYTTGLFGKWHLGSNYPYRPMDRGFDEWLGQGDGGTGTTDDWFFNDRVNDHYWHNGERKRYDGFAPDVFYEAAIDFIKTNQKSDKPFFIYLPTYLPHHPHTLPDPSMAEHYGAEVSKSVSYFFAGIERIDWNISRLRKVLKDLGEVENTIIIFMTDNGGTEGVKLFNAGMRGRKGDVYEGGHRVPFFMHWPKGGFSHGFDVKELTSHIDVLPTLIDLCDLKLETKPDFDGRSFKQQLFNPEVSLPERTLFVETQRTYKPTRWERTAGMSSKWRLVDNIELYDIETDLGQARNVINDHPEVVEKIRSAHKAYWAQVTPGDRDRPRFIIGNSNDPEVFLQSSDWSLPNNPPWNHAQVAQGKPQMGAWSVVIERKGKYLFDVYRWPREAGAPIKGIPKFNKSIDAWSANGSIDTLIYQGILKPLPVHTIQLKVGGQTLTKQVGKYDSRVTFEVELKEGQVEVQGTMFDSEGLALAGTYYIYISLKM